MPDLTDLVRDLAAALAHLDDAKQRVDDLKEQIRQQMPEGAVEVGDVTLSVSPGRRFNESKAIPLIPEDILPLVTYPETRVDRDKLKALLPDVYAASQDESTSRVTLR